MLGCRIEHQSVPLGQSSVVVSLSSSFSINYYCSEGCEQLLASSISITAAIRHARTIGKVMASDERFISPFQIDHRSMCGYQPASHRVVHSLENCVGHGGCGIQILFTRVERKRIQFPDRHCNVCPSSNSTDQNATGCWTSRGPPDDHVRGASRQMSW